MKRAFLILSLLFCHPAFGVITERYVNANGSGTQDGFTEINAMSWATMVSDINAGGKGGFRYNVKGTVSLGATTTISGSGVNTNYVTIEGYSVTPGDGFTGYNANGTLNTANFATISLGTTFRLSITGSFINFRALNITGNANNNIFSTTGGSGCMVHDCRVSNVSNGSSSSAASWFIATNSDVELLYGSGAHSTAYAVVATTANSRIVGCRVYCTTGGGIQHGSSSRVIDCVIWGSGANTLSGINMNATSANADMYGNTIVGWAQDGIRTIAATTASCLIQNNLITDNTGWGINTQGATQSAWVYRNNKFRNNGSGPVTTTSNQYEMTSYRDVIDSVLDYVDAANGNFSLLSTSSAVGAGFRPNRSIGALQRSQTGGSSGPRFYVTP